MQPENNESSFFNNEEKPRGLRALIEKYKALNPMSKRIANALIAITCLFILFVISRIVFSGNSAEEAATEQARQQEQQFIAKDMTAEADEALSAKIALQAEIQDLRTKNELELEALKYELQGFSAQLNNIVEMLNNLPEPSTAPAALPDAPMAGVPVTAESVGGIRRISATVTDNVSTEEAVKKNNYFPTTTLLKGILLNGLYAPTLSKGKSSPHPAFVRVDDLSILPNDFRRDIEGCEFMGEAYGELSDSRVHIRLTKLACIGYDGQKYFDNDVKGVVFGEDGTLGVQGEILANFNKILATSTFVYFLGGLGSAIKDSTQTTVISAEGNAQEFIEGSEIEKARKSMFAGAGEGLSMGLTKIGDFYMSILEDMVPVVRIQGGRDVEIKLTEGVELKLLDNDWTWAGELENEID